MTNIGNVIQIMKKSSKLYTHRHNETVILVNAFEPNIGIDIGSEFYRPNTTDIVTEILTKLCQVVMT